MKSKSPLYLLLREVAVVVALTTTHSLTFAAGTFAWQDTNTYRAPDFEGTFPIDQEAGAQLDLLFKGRGPTGTADENMFNLFRKGLRTATVYHQTLFSWLGNRFIWNQPEQNPNAIELAYHAAGSTNREISHNAIYFCLSTVRPITDPILHAFVDIAMRSEDPNVLSRIAWGASPRKDRLLFYLQPHLKSEDTKVRQHAESLREIFSGQTEAFAWAAQQARIKAEAQYADRLDEFRAALEKSDSVGRRATLDLIKRERIDLIMDESFIPAFAAAVNDPDAKVRQDLAVIAGGRWIWNGPQPAAAIDLMMLLSRDADPQVRRSANYYGLSTLRQRSDAIVERMIEMAMHDGFHQKDFRGRIHWGLEKEGERVRRVLRKWMADFKGNIIKAGFAYGFYLDFFAEKPTVNADFEKLLQASEEPVARALAYAPTTGYKPADMNEFFATLRQDLPPAYRSPVRWVSGELPFLVVEEREVLSIEKAVATSLHAKKFMDLPLHLHQLVQWGKEGEFESRK